MDSKATPPQGGAPIRRGIVLFKADASPAHRRRRTLFLLLCPLIASMVLWPVFPRFSGIFPLVLGLPQSFAWVVLALLAMFFLLLWLFLSENPAAEQADEQAEG